MSAPLRVTVPAMQDVVRLCRVAEPSEACGFVVANKERPDLGRRAVWMPNVHEEPQHHYRMSDQAIRLAYAEFDATGEEPVAVFHSHPTSEPLMSEEDLRAAVDASLAYLIVSLMPGAPRARAFRIEKYIGVVEHSEIPILVEESQPSTATVVPTGPWALAPGNRVRITYKRNGKNSLASVVATVTALSATVVSLDPQNKTAARAIDMERVRAVHVLAEGDLGRALRLKLRETSSDARAVLGSIAVERMPLLASALHQAFPPGIAVSMEGPL